MGQDMNHSRLVVSFVYLVYLLDLNGPYGLDGFNGR